MPSCTIITAYLHWGNYKVESPWKENSAKMHESNNVPIHIGPLSNLTMLYRFD